MRMNKDNNFCYFFNIFFLVAVRPPGHTLFPVRALYPESRSWPYEIRIYRHRSLL